MSIDKLWILHERLSRILSERLTSEKRELEKRLAQLQSGSPRERAVAGLSERPRRKYPRVLPKYRNPSAPSETWSGRGKQPRWLVAALKSGRQMNEFVIDNMQAPKNRSRR